MLRRACLSGFVLRARATKTRRLRWNPGEAANERRRIELRAKPVETWLPQERLTAFRLGLDGPANAGSKTVQESHDQRRQAALNSPVLLGSKSPEQKIIEARRG